MTLKSPVRQRLYRKAFTFAIMVGLSLLLGMGLGISQTHAVEAQSEIPSAALAQSSSDPYGMVDPIDDQQLAGYQTYLNQCATCHVALPAAVLPTQTWQSLIADSAHYGIALPPIANFDQRLILSYLQAYSRPNRDRRAIPYRLSRSAYFQALHPQVSLPQPLTLNSCVGCHIGASEQNYSGAAIQNDSGAAE